MSCTKVLPTVSNQMRLTSVNVRGFRSVSNEGTVALYFDTGFCFFGCHRMNCLLGNAPLTSQDHHVSRHSLACRTL